MSTDFNILRYPQGPGPETLSYRTYNPQRYQNSKYAKTVEFDERPKEQERTRKLLMPSEKYKQAVEFYCSLGFSKLSGVQNAPIHQQAAATNFFYHRRSQRLQCSSFLV